MIMPGTRALVASRWTPFAHTVAFPGYDFTGAPAAMQVRLRRDAPGDPIIDLVSATAGTEGLSFVVESVGGLTTSTLTIQIDEATLEAILLNAGKAGADVPLKYDLHITGGGLPKTRWMEGDFTILAGVTQ